ncbi:MAG: DUF1223 domain-containing protein [Rhizomicrobium sp.]|jgi:hypothetical protein
MRHCRAILALAAVLLATAPHAWAGGKRPVVVELYTSQGCDSCPPADLFLAKLADRKDLIALSLPVTYWDMLGWKDTFASENNTRRQKAYAQLMGHGGVYTPQMIVDGANDVVGSREPAVDAAIDARAADLRDVPVTLSATPHEFKVNVGAGGERGDDATIWMLAVQARATVAIHAGENEGRTMTYRNIVRDIRAIGMWKGQPVALDLPRQDMTSEPHDAFAVIVQENGFGRIVGAAMLSAQ